MQSRLSFQEATAGKLFGEVGLPYRPMVRLVVLALWVSAWKRWHIAAVESAHR